MKKPDFSVFFNTIQYKMRQNQTNRFPHLFHKVPVNNFCSITFHWPTEHVVKISKGVYFSDIKVHFLDTLARPVDLTVITKFLLLMEHFIYKSKSYLHFDLFWCPQLSERDCYAHKVVWGAGYQGPVSDFWDKSYFGCKKRAKSQNFVKMKEKYIIILY